SEESKSILFVDDEKSVLRSLRRAFMKSGHQLYFADSGELALKMLAASQGKIDMVISDMWMPGMDGYTFLKEVKEKYPQVIRLILSGFVEERYVYKALIDGSAKAYLAKPWNTRELIALVNGLIEIEEKLNEKKLLALINTVDELPVLPKIYYQVMVLIDADADFDKIVAVIEQDPALTAKILQVANSAFFKSGTASLKRAAVFIGLMTLKDIVAGSVVFQTLAAPAQGPYAIDSIWQHAVACNSLVSEMYELMHDERVPEDVASVGLLHNVGLLVMLKYFPEALAEIVTRRQQYPWKSLALLEEEVLGVDHAHLGAFLLNWWNMPYPMVEAALYHHNPLAAAPANREIVILLHIADHLALVAGGVADIEPLAPEVLAAVELPECFRELCLVAE
ncbi:MAG: HDOD domain-containing protein, partial [Deltaproteobacteria bacterium]|nr:HDOD domain-containing protein [Deltaproteobacteria bacterium]